MRFIKSIKKIDFEIDYNYFAKEVRTLFFLNSRTKGMMLNLILINV